MTRKWLARFALIFFSAALWGCSSGGSGGSDVPSGSTPPAEMGSSSCEVCHLGNDSEVFTQGWVGSAHDVAGDSAAGCEGCHGGGQYHKGIGPIPVPEPGADQCVTCHDLASIGHYDNPATGTVIEGLVVKTAEENGCKECHYYDHNPVLTINVEWAESGHGGFIASSPVTSATADAWVHYNWDDTATRGSCQRCHTATGIGNYLDDPNTYASNGSGNDFSHLAGWAAAGGSGQQEVLYCSGCHRDVSTGELRNHGAHTEVYAGSPAGSPTVTVNFPDINQSNVCLGCHVGREIGEVIEVSNGDFSNLNFINSHYLLAAPNIFNVSGYEYGDYQDYGYHQNVGMNNTFNTGTSGPCVACHMSVGTGHTYVFFEKDVDGTITRVDTPICTNCHASMDAATIEAVKEKFYAAAEELRVALDAKGIEYSPDYPYFYVKGTTNAFKNWDGVDLNGAVAGGTGFGKEVMGAAFNYHLIISDPCSYVHNNDYALKLLADSIDFINDGLLDGDASLASDLIGQGINLDSGAGYSPIHDTPVLVAVVDPRDSEATCSTCHSKAPHYGGYPDTSLSPVAAIRASAGAQWVNDQLISCAECHADNDPSLNQEVVSQYAHSGHGDVTGTWGIRDFNGSCSRCHTTTGYINDLVSGTTFTYGTSDPRQVLNCNACHASIGENSAPLRAAGAYAATWSTNNVTASVFYPDAGDSNLCIRCHSARRAGANITNSATTTAHYLPAAAVVFGGTAGMVDITATANGGFGTGEFLTGGGYEFTGQSYADLGPHKTVGGASGPCVGCHMSGDAGHLWEAVAKDEATGAITAINSSSCNTEACHDGAITPTFLNNAKAAFEIELDRLESFLNVRQLYYYDGSFYTAPYVVGGTNTTANNAYYVTKAALAPSVSTRDLQGAAYNFWLFKYHGADPAGYVHNVDYAYELVTDSSDLLNDGTIDGDF